jgi:hypothetical protein
MYSSYGLRALTAGARGAQLYSDAPALARESGREHTTRTNRDGTVMSRVDDWRKPNEPAPSVHHHARRTPAWSIAACTGNRGTGQSSFRCRSPHPVSPTLTVPPNCTVRSTGCSVENPFLPLPFFIFVRSFPYLQGPISIFTEMGEIFFSVCFYRIPFLPDIDPYLFRFSSRFKFI